MGKIRELAGGQEDGEVGHLEKISRQGGEEPSPTCQGEGPNQKEKFSIPRNECMASKKKVQKRTHWPRKPTAEPVNVAAKRKSKGNKMTKRGFTIPMGGFTTPRGKAEPRGQILHWSRLKSC